MAKPATPPGHTLATALDHSQPLTGLLQRVRASQQRLAVIAPLLPPGVSEVVRPGPLDDEVWVLLVDNTMPACWHALRRHPD